MATGYVRQSAGTIITGNTIQASDFNNEYNLLASFADGTVGHNHSGGSGLGPQLSLTASVTGVLPIANGGTNATTAATAISNLLSGSIIGAGNGGTGVNNTGTITLGGNLVTSGAFSTTLTVTANTNVTLPVSGTLVGSNDTGTVTNTMLAGSIAASKLTGTDIATVGTITTGTWNASVIAGQYGGTGVANTGKTITIGGNVTHSGAFTTTLTVTANTNVTLPTTGTLVGSADTGTVTNTMLAGSIAASKLILTDITTLTGLTTAASLSTVGTITTGVWNGTIIGVAKGGTGLGTLTANSVILGAGTSTPTFVAAGTNGNVLTDNGTTWVSSPLPSSSAMVLISSQTVGSAVAAVSVTSGINSTYSHYIWEISNLYGTTNLVDAYVTIQQGGSFISTNYNSSVLKVAGTGVSGYKDSAAAQFNVAGTLASIDNSSSQVSIIRFEFWNPSTVAYLTSIFETVQSAGSAAVYTRGGGQVANTAATTGIKLTLSSGNIASGTFKLYGVV